jgi:hypothetical protein
LANLEGYVGFNSSNLFGEGTYVLSKVGTETGTEFFLKEKLSWQEKWGKQA